MTRDPNFVSEMWERMEFTERQLSMTTV